MFSGVPVKSFIGLASEDYIIQEFALGVNERYDRPSKRSDKNTPGACTIKLLRV
jgi:hypothetical protein